MTPINSQNVHDQAKTSPKRILRKYWENFCRNYAPFYIQGRGIITEMTVLQEFTHCTMCILGTTMALWSKAEIQKYTFWWEKIFLRLFFLCCFRKKTLKLVSLFHFPALKHIFGTLKISQNDLEIPNLEFESHGFLENQVYLPTEQAETNICWIIYQDASFKICLSLFGWKVNILLHCALGDM